MKKYLALVLALAMLLTLVAIPTMAEEDNRPTIRVTILDRAQVPADQGTYEDNWATRWINENSPVKVDFVACPAAPPIPTTTSGWPPAKRPT